jgi:hypothetical protein
MHHPRLLEIKPPSFERREQRLDIPTLRVNRKRSRGSFDRHQQQVLVILGQRANHEDSDSHDTRFTQFKDFALFEIVEPHPRRRCFCALLDHSVRFDADHGVHRVLKQGLKPRRSNELSIRREALNATRWDQFQHPLENRFALRSIAIACFLEIHLSNGERDAVVGDADHEEVDVYTSELPIGAIHRQHDFLVGDEAQHETSNQILSEVNVEEAFDAPGVALEFRASVECNGDLREVDGTDFEEGDEEAADELHAAGVNVEVGL